jgi:hypothetical protein
MYLYKHIYVLFKAHILYMFSLHIDTHILFLFCFGGMGFELRASHCKESALSLKPHLQSILLWLFWRLDLVNYLSGLTLNHEPPNLSLPGS